MLTIDRIHALSDNYIWAIRNRNMAWVVDPGDALPVLNYLQFNKLRLAGIALTHWHSDHQGGVIDLLKKYPDCQVIGSNKTLNGPSTPVHEGEVVEVLGAQFEIYEVPGHTLDHIAYVCNSDKFEFPVAFTGDTLFVAGCGRLFEGTAENMFESLAKLNLHPANTQIYCAHEYSQANLQFANHEAPSNKYISERFSMVRKLRRLGKPTVPTNLELERKTNLFLRAKTVEELREIRQAKDCF